MSESAIHFDIGVRFRQGVGFNNSRRAITLSSDHSNVVRKTWKRGFWRISWWCWQVESIKYGTILESGVCFTKATAEAASQHWAKVYDKRIAIGNHWEKQWSRQKTTFRS